MIDVVSRDIARVAADVRRLGDDRTIVNEMAREIRRAVPPIRKAVRRRALAILPKRGRLNAWVARGSVRASIRRSGSSAGVSLVDGRNSTRGRSHFRAIDAGRLRAPNYGRRSDWHTQAVPSGFFTDAVTTEGAQEFRDAVVVAVEAAKRKVNL